MFSHVYQDRERLTNTIKKQCAVICQLVNPEMTVRWRKIVDPSAPKPKWKQGKRQKTTNDDMDIKALHVETIPSLQDRLILALSKIYCKDSTSGPDGEKMRFIPSPALIQHSKILEYYSDIIRRQAWFHEGITRVATFDVLNIDGRSPPLKSLRTLLMEMKTTDGKPMFIGIDKCWDDSTSIIFPKIYMKEAKNRIADLGSYLHFKHGDQILLLHFTPSAAARAVQSPWNEDLQCAESQLGKYLLSVVQDCDAIEWLPLCPLSSIRYLMTTGHSSPLEFTSLPTKLHHLTLLLHTTSTSL